MKHYPLWLKCTVLSLILGCGEEPPTKPSAPAMGPTQRAFIEAANKFRVPARMLLATAFLESGISPESAQSIYRSADQNASQLRGLAIGQTAFGLPYAKLGLTGDASSSQLKTQIEAYAQALATHIQHRGVELTPHPGTTEEKVRWIWEIAQFHRAGLQQRRSVQVIFALELINQLNSGFFWQDHESKESINFSKENPQIKQSEFSRDQQNIFQISTERGEFFPSTYLRLTQTPSTDRENHPRRVEVIHCPFTLSGCLELQQSEDDAIRLNAHYLIPTAFKSTQPQGQPNSTQDGIVENVIQTALHEQVVHLTSQTGELRIVDDAVVIMLVGNSGRIVEGARTPADPTWLTGTQLRRLGDVVISVCQSIKERFNADYDKCISSGDEGVRFYHQGASEVYRWGEIPDFDEPIFEAYLKGQNPSNGLAFDMGESPRRFSAGANIPISLTFDKATRIVELEHLVRCPDSKLVWTPLSTAQIRSDNRLTIHKYFYDSGPNGNGQHFIRARATAQKDELIGWQVISLFLTQYEEGTSTYSRKTCLRNGT